MTALTEFQIYSLENEILTQRINLKKSTKESFVDQYNGELAELISKRKILQKKMKAIKRETKEILKHLNNIGVENEL